MAKRYNTADGTHIMALSDLPEYEIAPGDQDVRGWRVVASAGRDIGRVEDLIVDLDTKAALYLVVEPDESESASLADRRFRQILVPIDRVRIEEQDHRVAVDGTVISAECDDAPVDRRARM